MSNNTRFILYVFISAIYVICISLLLGYIIVAIEDFIGGLNEPEEVGQALLGLSGIYC